MGLLVVVFFVASTEIITKRFLEGGHMTVPHPMARRAATSVSSAAQEGTGEKIVTLSNKQVPKTKMAAPGVGRIRAEGNSEILILFSYK